jgi:hypothetical protein
LGVQQDSQLKEQLNPTLLLQDRNLPTARPDLSQDQLGAGAGGGESREKTPAAEIDPPEEFQSDSDTPNDALARPAAAVVVRRRSKFQRSVSIGSPRGKEWSPPGAAGPSAVGGLLLTQRKRNSSHEDQYRCGGSSGGTAEFLSHTSPAWKRLFEPPETAGAGGDNDAGIAGKLMESPVLGFLLQWNDLESVRLAMEFTLRKAVCRAHAMQAFNWLLRSVSQPVCLHDLLWCLISALQQQPLRQQQQHQQQQQQQNAEQPAAAAAAKKDKEEVAGNAIVGVAAVPAVEAAAAVLRMDEDAMAVVKERDYGFEHPMSDLCLVGGAVKTLPVTFHTLLQTISGPS